MSLNNGGYPDGSARCPPTAHTVQIQVPVDGAVLPGPCPSVTPISGVASTTVTGTTMDIVFIVDVSGSMTMTDGPYGWSRIRAVRTAMKALVNDVFYPSVVNVGIVQFGGPNSRVVLGLTNDYAAVISAIDSLYALIGWNTPMGEGILLARQEVAANARPEANRIALLLSDGYHNAGIEPVPQAELAAMEGITINTYGFGTADPVTLTQIANLTGGLYTPVSTANLHRIFEPDINGVWMDFVEISDGTSTWQATVTAQIGNTWIWESPTLGTATVAGTTYTANARWIDGATAVSLPVTVYCQEGPIDPDPEGQGCSRGFWRQPHHFTYWVNHDPDDLFCDVFDCSTAASLSVYGGKSLLEVLREGGGELYQLGAQAVAALLNAASPKVDYPLTEAAVIHAVNGVIASGDPGEIESLKNQLDEMNNLCCPLGCFIATAAFGSARQGKIDVLRTFRDRFLLPHAAGRALVEAYYTWSPPVAERIAQRPWLRSVVRILVAPAIGLVSLFV